MILAMRVRGAMAAFALFLLFVWVGAATAQECEVLDKYGEPRDCTYSEELGDCTADATDSWDQCEEWAWEDWEGGWGWDRLEGALKSSACDMAYAVDLASCAPASVFTHWLPTF